MKNKILFNSIILIFSLLGSCLVIDKPLKADQNTPACPDPSLVNISEIGDINSDNNPSESFVSRAKALGCRGDL